MDGLRQQLLAGAGERLDYAIEGAGGTFSPSSQGSLVLEGTSATVVIHYTAPQVGSATDFTHSIRLTNRDGHSVSTTFRLRVRPPSSEGVRDTSVAVRFNPVINALSAVRVPGAPQVAFEASVSDDRPLSELSYSWSLAPEGAEAPPAFSPQANPTQLQGYTLEQHGTLRLEVTDAEGGTTTLLYLLPPNQFPDNPTEDTGFTSLLAGEGHTCVLTGEGAVRCWGRNDLGDDESPSSSPLTTPRPPVFVEATQTPGTGGGVTFRVRGMDPQGSPLTFSWTSTTGTFSAPSTTEDTSEAL